MRRLRGLRTTSRVVSVVGATLAVALWAGASPASARDARSGAVERSGTPVLDRFRLGAALLEAGRLDAAREEYRRFAREFSKSPWAPDAQIMSGEAEFRRDPSSPKALEIFRQAAARDPAAGLAESAQLRVAEVLYNQGRVAESLEAFRAGQNGAGPGALRHEMLLGEGMCRLALGEWEQARGVLETLAANAPAYHADRRYRYLMGLAAYQVARDSEAIAHLKEVPSDEAALFYLGRAYVRFGRPLLGVEKLKQLLHEFPESAFSEEAEFLLGEAFLAAHDHLSAIASYEKFLRQYPRTSLRTAAVFKIAVSHFSLEDYLQARSGFQSVLQEAPLSEFAAPALYLIGESFRRQERYKDAAFAYSDLIQSYPAHELVPSGQFLLAYCQWRQEQYGPSQTTLHELLRRFPDHVLAAPALVLLGHTLSQEREHGAAARAYRAAHDRLPTSELGESSLAFMCRAIYLNQSDDELVSANHYILNRLPPSASAWRAATLLYIAEGYLRRGLVAEALALYRQVQSLYPAHPLVPYALDGAAWSLFLKGDDGGSQRERQNLSDYGRRWSVPEEVGLLSPYETANSLFNQKRYLEALSLYSRFASDHPGHDRAAEARYREGLAYYRLESFGQAVQTWERVEQEFAGSPVAVRAVWQIADTYFRARKYDTAIATYERILSRHAGAPAEAATARLRVAQAHFNHKSLSLAVPAFEQVIRVHPNSEQAQESLEFLASLLEDPAARAVAAQTLEQLGRDMAGSPLGVEARYRLAADLYSHKDYDQASRMLETVVADLMAGSRLADSQFFLAESYYQRGRYAEAASAYDRFVSNFPQDERVALARFRRASAAFKAERYDRAGEEFLEVARLHPQTEYVPVSLYNAGLAFKKLQRWETAIAAFNTYAQKFPEKAKAERVAEEVAGLYESQHNFPAAIRVLEGLRQTLKPEEEVWMEVTLRMGEDYLAQGDDARAIEAWRAASRFQQRGHVTRLTVLARLGEVLERVGRAEEAVVAYRDLASSTTKPEWVAAAKARIEALGPARRP